MSEYTIRAVADVPDLFGGRYPGAMRFMTEPLEARQVALTHRLMPPRSGGKGGYGHRHKRQEEIYYVVSGTLQFKLEDEVIHVPAGSAVRVAPAVTRSIWNDGPGDAELVICSIRLDDPRADGELVNGFWPADGTSP
jgi:mannose-6-phosphate isomerase-like protein (cupin superfamily)